MDTLTVAGIKTAASKVSSLTKLGYELGYKSKINGTVIKQIKALVPDIAELLGKPAKVEQPEQPVEQKVEQPVEQKALDTVQKAKKEKAPKAKGDSPYRGAYGVLFTEAAKDFVDRAELIQKVAKATGKDEKLVQISYYVLSNPKHRSNGGRSKEEVNSEGKVRLVACQEAATDTSENSDTSA